MTISTTEEAFVGKTVLHHQRMDGRVTVMPVRVLHAERTLLKHNDPCPTSYLGPLIMTVIADEEPNALPDHW
jgi:hypothetical protein